MPTVFERLVILGFAYETVIIENQPNAEDTYRQTIEVDIPDGTTYVLPFLSGTMLMFGRIRSMDPGEGAVRLTIEADDHHYGYGHINIRTAEIGPRRATLELSMELADKNADDRWCGAASFRALFLGPQ
jgi:hypothetical protein